MCIARFTNEAFHTYQFKAIYVITSLRTFTLKVQFAFLNYWLDNEVKITYYTDFVVLKLCIDCCWHVHTCTVIACQSQSIENRWISNLLQLFHLKVCEKHILLMLYIRINAFVYANTLLVHVHTLVYVYCKHNWLNRVMYVALFYVFNESCIL